MSPNNVLNGNLNIEPILKIMFFFLLNLRAEKDGLDPEFTAIKIRESPRDLTRGSV